MRMKAFVAIVTLGFAAGALAQDVATDYDKAANFGALKTYALKLGTTWGNPLGEKRVMQEFEEALNARGWKPAPEGQADAMVVLHGATETKKDLE